MQNQEWKIRAGKGKSGGGRGWGKLYNCCKGVWLGGQRNNQLKALMASDGVAVQGRWQLGFLIGVGAATGAGAGGCGVRLLPTMAQWRL